MEEGDITEDFAEGRCILSRRRPEYFTRSTAHGTEQIFVCYSNLAHSQQFSLHTPNFILKFLGRGRFFSAETIG